MPSLVSSWDLDGFVSEQRYYCSESPIDPLNLPVPKAVLAGDVLTYIDSVGIEKGKQYYLAVGSVKNGIEKLSDQVIKLAGVAWIPANLSSAAKLWFSSDSVVVDGSNRVGQINAFGSTTITATQANNTNKPVRANGRVRSDGVDDYMVINGAQAIFNNVGAAYIFSVVSRESLDSVVVSNRPVITFSTGATNGYHASLDVGGAAAGQQNQIRVGARLLQADTYETVFSGFQMEANKDYIIAGIIDFNARKLELYIDGVLVASKTGAFSSNNNTAATNSSYVNLFAQPAVPPSVVAGCSLSSLIVNNVALSASDRQKLEGWAAHKYGLTANLPSGHPYKTLVPVL